MTSLDRFVFYLYLIDIMKTKYQFFTRLLFTSVALLIGTVSLLAERPEVPPRAIKTPVPIIFNKAVNSDSFVSMIINIDERGNVTSAQVRASSDPDLNKASLRTVRKWKYQPAYNDGKPVASTIVQPINFGTEPFRRVEKKAIAIHTPAADMPVKYQHIEGEVGVAVSIDSAGYVTRVKIIYSSDERLNLAVLNAIRNWEYEPAKRNGRAVRSKQIQPFVFDRGAGKKSSKIAIQFKVDSISVNPTKRRPAMKAILAQVQYDDE